MKPDFKSFTDDEVKMSYTLIQRLCYAYATDKEVIATLNKIYSDLLCERSPRNINESAENIKITGEVRNKHPKGIKLCFPFKKISGKRLDN